MKGRLGNQISYVPRGKMKFFLASGLPACVICVLSNRNDIIQKGFPQYLERNRNLHPFSHILPGLPFGQNSSYIHICMVSLLCEFSDVNWVSLLARRISFSCFINRVVSLPEFSGIYLGLISYTIFHIHYIHVISPHCEFSNVF